MYCLNVGWGFKFGQVEGWVNKRTDKSVEVERRVHWWIDKSEVEGRV